MEIAEQAGEPEGSFALIAMATHGRTGLQHLLMGSVTEKILDHTRLPMLIVRSHEQKALAEVTEASRDTTPHAENGKHITWHFRSKSKTPIPD